MKVYVVIIFALILVFALLILRREHFTSQKIYSSNTFTKDNYEVYSATDKYYPSYKINLTKKNKFIRLLKYGDDFFQKNKINYSIIFGTMLGYIRNKKFIPYDHDLDCIMGTESIPKLIKLAEDVNQPHVMFNTEIKKYKPDFKSDQIYLILNKTLLTNNGYGNRYNCNGDKVSQSQDRCGFNGLFGRFILNNIEYDIFPYSYNFKNKVKKNSKNERHLYNYPDKIEDMCKISPDEIFRDELEGVHISVLNHQQSIELLKYSYGNNFMKPNK